MALDTCPNCGCTYLPHGIYACGSTTDAQSQGCELIVTLSQQLHELLHEKHEQEIAFAAEIEQAEEKISSYKKLLKKTPVQG